MTYVYLKTEPRLWTVGFYDPEGRWQSESDHASSEDAARRVAWLNGGGWADRLDAIEATLDRSKSGTLSLLNQEAT